MTPDDVLAAAAEDNIRLIRFLYCDPSGMIRGKTVHGTQLADKIHEGVGLTRAQNAVNVFEELVHIPGMEPVGELRVVPDPKTYTVLPWLERTASMICDQLEYDYRATPTCGRSALKRAIDYAAAQGVRMFAAFEVEFYLATKDDDGYHPYNDGPVYSSAGMDRVAPVVDAIVDGLTAQGMVVEQAINEYGPGQQEVAVRYTDALAAADMQLKLRDTVRGTAEVGYGLSASLAPKPFLDAVGSGAHVHFSLWSPDGKTNLLYNPDDPQHLSDFGLSFVAGLLEHLPGLIAVTCPSYNSYARLVPDAWAGSTVAWGYDNRECTVRVASPFRGREASSINIELKATDSSCNPHLALAAILRAGLDGVERGLRPPQPALHNPAHLPEAEALACGVRPLPTDQMEAHRLMAADPVLVDALGQELVDALLAVRGAEYRAAKEMGDKAAAERFFPLL